MKSLKILREEKGIKQCDMAKELNVTQPTIVNWETDDIYPPAKKLPEIARFFSCTIDDLFKIGSE